MTSYLLDTTVIIDYLRGRPEVVGLIKRLFAEGSSLGCCPINIIEVYAGMREKEREDTEEFLENLEYYELSKGIARQAGGSKREYQKKGITLSLSDVAIASIAMANDLTFLTDNQKHYPMSKLKIKELTPNAG